MEDFVRTRGMVGYAPTQGQFPRRLFTWDTRWMRCETTRSKMRYLFPKGVFSRPYDAAFRRLLVFLVEKSEK